jgi:hypothetical protein
MWGFEIGWYAYILVLLGILAVIVWVWRRAKNWWMCNSLTISTIPIEYRYWVEVSHIENSLWHLWRLLMVEWSEEMEGSHWTWSLIREQATAVLEVYQKIFHRAHYESFVKVWNQRQQQLYQILATLFTDEETLNENVLAERKSHLRRLNRQLAQIHADWMGLDFDGPAYARALQSLDESLFCQARCILEEAWEESLKYFHEVLYFQQQSESYLIPQTYKPG